MVPITTNALLQIPMLLMPSRWGFEGVIRAERLAVASAEGWSIPLKGVQDSPPDFISSELFQCALAQMQSRELTGAWGFSGEPWLPAAVLCGMTVALLGTVIVLLSRRFS